MRRIAPLFVTAALVLGGVGAVAAPVGASTPAKTSAFCKGIKNFNLPDLTGNVNEATAGKAAKQLKKLAKKATGKVKQATNTLADALQEVADGGSATDILTGDYVKAAGTFSLAAVKCYASGISLPDISLPGS
ncbi:MAG: hypothetical protein MUP67_09030 [Acidimicrobiia bacterium]|nr:hypothetical protein [Acidimicrobiia bacterium]